jgi:hypothetical protein
MIRYNLLYTAYGKDFQVMGMTEGQATKAFRDLVSNFYNREEGCTNGLARHYSEIYISRNGRTIVQYTGGDIFTKRGMLIDWEQIFTQKITQI